VEGKKMRILSGIQPSGILHLGNYFGAMKQFVDLQDNNESFIFIANYHAMNTIKDPKLLRENTLEVAISYLSVGLDPKKVAIFRQSDIKEVCELTWILGTLTPMGFLERAHSYKDTLAKGISADVGLFAYPVLMTSDIIIYQSDIVPVGKDQKQHVEIARDIAIKFNNTYGETFRLPSPKIEDTTAIIPGIDGQKMSKSYNNFISPFWNENEIKKQIMKIVTDSTPVDAPKDPDKCNVFNIYKLLATKVEIDDIRAKYINGGFGYGDAKKILLAKILDYFAKKKKRYLELKNDLGSVEAVLKDGAARASAVANKTMELVRKNVGI
jgi:tryptophanyl-tRNA synthetase